MACGECSDLSHIALRRAQILRQMYMSMFQGQLQSNNRPSILLRLLWQQRRRYPLLAALCWSMESPFLTGLTLPAGFAR